MAVSFFSILTLHLILHRRFIAGLLRNSETPRLRLALGALGLIVLLALAIVPLIVPVENALHHPQTRESIDSPGW